MATLTRFFTAEMRSLSREGETRVKFRVGADGAPRVGQDPGMGKGTRGFNVNNDDD